MTNKGMSDYQNKSECFRRRLLAMNIKHSLLTRADVRQKNNSEKKRQFSVAGGKLCEKMTIYIVL